MNNENTRSYSHMSRRSQNLQRILSINDMRPNKQKALTPPGTQSTILETYVPDDTAEGDKQSCHKRGRCQNSCTYPATTSAE